MARGSSKKFGIDFEGLTVLENKLKDLDVDMKSVAESALKATHHFVTPKITAAMSPHNDTGETSDAIIKNAVVEWSGNVASMNVGFDFNSGGWKSIFLMYGTKLHGQPHITPDKTLYNAIYGSQTKKEVAKIQEQVYVKRLERAMK